MKIVVVGQNEGLAPRGNLSEVSRMSEWCLKAFGSPWKLLEHFSSRRELSSSTSGGANLKRRFLLRERAKVGHDLHENLLNKKMSYKSKHGFPDFRATLFTFLKCTFVAAHAKGLLGTHQIEFSNAFAGRVKQHYLIRFTIGSKSGGSRCPLPAVFCLEMAHRSLVLGHSVQKN